MTFLGYKEIFCWPEKRFFDLNVAASRMYYEPWLFPRCNPYSFDELGKIKVSLESHIGLTRPDKPAKVLIYKDMVSSNTIGVEDGACYGKHIICVSTSEAKNPLSRENEVMPTPCRFYIDIKGRAYLVDILTGRLVKRWCKGLTPLPSRGGDYFWLLRPVIGEGSDREDPKIILCWQRRSADLELEEVADFLRPTEEMPGLNVSAPPVLTDCGWLLVYHRLRVSSVGGVEYKRYEHYAMLLDRDDPLKVIANADKPFLLPEFLPENRQKIWVKGPIYIRNAWISDGYFWTIVTKEDACNYLVWMPLNSIYKTLKGVDRPSLVKRYWALKFSAQYCICSY